MERVKKMTKYYMATISQKGAVKEKDAADTQYLNENNTSFVLLTEAEVKKAFERRQQLLSKSKMRQIYE